MRSLLDSYIQMMQDCGDEEEGDPRNEQENPDGNKAEKQFRTVLFLHEERLRMEKLLKELYSLCAIAAGQNPVDPVLGGMINERACTLAYALGAPRSFPSQKEDPERLADEIRYLERKSRELEIYDPVLMGIIEEKKQRLYGGLTDKMSDDAANGAEKGPIHDSLSYLQNREMDAAAEKDKRGSYVNTKTEYISLSDEDFQKLSDCGRVVFDKGSGPESIVLYMDGDSALREKYSAPCFNFNLVYDSLNDHQLWEIFMILRKAEVKPDRSGYVVLNDLLFSDKLNGGDVAQILKFIDLCRR